IFIIFGEKRHEFRLGAHRVRDHLDIARELAIELVAGAAHVPVAGHEPDAPVAASLKPPLGLLRVGPRVDRFRAEVDAAFKQSFLAAEPMDEIDLPDGGVRSGDQQPPAFAPGEERSGMLDPSRPAGNGDDRLDLRGVGRSWLTERHREQRKAKAVNDDQQRKQTGNHKRSRNALNSAALATWVASTAMASGSMT